MKRMLAGILMVLMLASMLALGVSAKENEKSEDVIYFDNGDYLVISITESVARASGRKSGKTTSNYYGEDGVREWSAVLSGTFTYNGSSAACTASSCSVSISDTAWYVISKTASKSGSTATANLTMGRKLLGVTINKVPVTMTLSCDANGNLS